MINNMIDEKFITPLKFALMVEELVNVSNLEYIESIIQVCSQRSIDLSDVSGLINTPLRAKLEAEAVENNRIKPSSSARLPV